MKFRHRALRLATAVVVICGGQQAAAQQQEWATLEGSVYDACTRKPLGNVWVCAEFPEGPICGRTNPRGHSRTDFALPSKADLKLTASMERRNRTVFSSISLGIAEAREYQVRFYLNPGNRPCGR